MKRTQPLGPGRKALERGSTFKSRGTGLRHTGRSTRRLAAGLPPASAGEARKAWAMHARSGPCAMCGSTIGVTGHHILPLADLKTHGVPPTGWYDLRNLLRLCMEPSPERCHQRHELHVRRVPRALVLAHAPEVVEFAREVGLDWLLDREYPR